MNVTNLFWGLGDGAVAETIRFRATQTATCLGRLQETSKCQGCVQHKGKFDWWANNVFPANGSGFRQIAGMFWGPQPRELRYCTPGMRTHRMGIWPECARTILNRKCPLEGSVLHVKRRETRSGHTDCWCT